MNIARQLQKLCGTPRPTPEAAAARLGLELRPRVGAAYSYDGQTITYDARLSRVQQREAIARACWCKLHEHRMRELDTLAPCALRAAFSFD